MAFTTLVVAILLLGLYGSAESRRSYAMVALGAAAAGLWMLR